MLSVHGFNYQFSPYFQIISYAGLHNVNVMCFFVMYFFSKALLATNLRNSSFFFISNERSLDMKQIFFNKLLKIANVLELYGK